MLQRWLKQVEIAYRELIEEFQSATDKHIEAIRISLKEVVMHDYRYSLRGKYFFKERFLIYFFFF